MNYFKNRMKELAEQRTGFKMDFVKDVKYQEGKTYYNGYWGTTYTVLKYYNTKDNPLGWNSWAVTVKWADGHETTHCTNLDLQRDFEVIGA